VCWGDEDFRLLGSDLRSTSLMVYEVKHIFSVC
jgi:hypothetical protein